MVRMHVHPAGNDGFAFGIDHAVGSRCFAIADAGDASGLDHNRAGTDDLLVRQRDQPRIRECHGPLRNGSRNAQVNFGRVRLRRVDVIDKIFVRIAALDGIGIAPARIHAAIEADRCDGERGSLALQPDAFLAGGR